ncbi:cupredoxin domain-containing protein [Corynebacterium mastitidis]
MGISPRAPRAQSGSWHRRASRPVTVWLVVLVLVGLAHSAIPDYRWVLIHTFTLGAVTNSIVVWSQHFTESFLDQRLDHAARPPQLRRIALLSLGVVGTLAGQVAAATAVTHLGAGIVAAALLWHAWALFAQARQRRGAPLLPCVLGYVASALCLTAGAAIGALLASSPEGATHNRLVQAHLILNLGGFLGLAASATLAVLFPALWGRSPRRAAPGTHPWVVLGLHLCGLCAAVPGALLGYPWVLFAGLALYTGGWLLACAPWFRIALSAGPKGATYGSVSVTASLVWLLGCLVWFCVDVLRQGAHAAPPSTALLVGFGGQLLVGMMSYLLPVTMRVRSAWGLRETYRAGMLRVTLTNGGLALWLLADYSWLRVAASALAVLGMAAFLPLMVRAVRAQVGGRRQAASLSESSESQESQEVPEVPHARGGTGQVALGLSLLALVTALCGGLAGPSGTAPGSGPGGGPETRVSVRAGDMAFEPATVTVPRGHRLVIELRNEDSRAHDLKLTNGARSGRVTPGREATVDAGIITADVPGWCTIAGHHSRGMNFDVLVED